MAGVRTDREPFPVGAVASDIMIVRPKTLAHDVTVAAARAAFADDHVHLLLLVRDGRLVGTLRRIDLVPEPAGAALGRALLGDRVVGPDAEMVHVHERLLRTGDRRLAVAADDGRLLGLLCLKRDRSGYCTDEGVAARAADRRC